MGPLLSWFPAKMAGEGGILILISADQNMWGTDKTSDLCKQEWTNSSSLHCDLFADPLLPKFTFLNLSASPAAVVSLVSILEFLIPNNSLRACDELF